MSEPPAKKAMLEEKEISDSFDLDGFDIVKVLLNDPKSKRIHVHGKIKKDLILN